MISDFCYFLYPTFYCANTKNVQFIFFSCCFRINLNAGWKLKVKIAILTKIQKDRRVRERENIRLWITSWATKNTLHLHQLSVENRLICYTEVSHIKYIKKPKLFSIYIIKFLDLERRVSRIYDCIHLIFFLNTWSILGRKVGLKSVFDGKFNLQ